LGPSSLVSLNFPQRIVQQASAMALRGFPGGSSGPVIKKIIRVEVPIEKYPNVISKCIEISCFWMTFFIWEHIQMLMLFNAASSSISLAACWGREAIL
jgi:hypothetical protein